MIQRAAKTMIIRIIAKITLTGHIYCIDSANDIGFPGNIIQTRHDVSLIGNGHVDSCIALPLQFFQSLFHAAALYFNQIILPSMPSSSNMRL